MLGPPLWDLGHIGQQEELWLLRDGNPDRPGMLPTDVERLYDAFVNSRASRARSRSRNNSRASSRPSSSGATLTCEKSK